jgi:ParB family chromosome partitioning protein
LNLALVENIQRQELNAIEEAQAYKRLIETLGFTQEMVAQRVGRDRTFITNYLRLLRLPEDIQQLVEIEKLSTGHARALLGIDDPEIQRKLAKNVMDKGLSVRQTEYVVKSTIEGKSQTKDEASVDNKRGCEHKSRRGKLRRKLSSKVNVLINQRNGGGKIEITFYDEKDLGRIYDLIMGKDE